MHVVHTVHSTYSVYTRKSLSPTPPLPPTFGPKSPGWSVKIKASSFRADLKNFLLSLCIPGL